MQASISKWMDVSLDIPGCTLGLYARDGNLLRALPRPVTNIMAAAANRLELLVACAAGDYKLRTGYGPLVPDAQCMSTHCELIKDIIANIKVVRGRVAAPQAHAAAAPCNRAAARPPGTRTRLLPTLTTAAQNDCQLRTDTSRPPAALRAAP